MSIKEGTPCLAKLGDPWVDCVVTCVHPGGTFTVEEVSPRSYFMKDWHGLTLPDLSFDEDNDWAALVGDKKALSWPDVQRLFADIGVPISDEAMVNWWGNAEHRAPQDVLDLLRAAGWSAKALMPSRRPNPMQPLWWNQTRMGGRDPNGLAAPIDQQTALDLLKLDQNSPARNEAIEAVEKNLGVSIPTLIRLITANDHAASAFLHLHPNNPAWLPAGQWEPLSGQRENGVDGDFLLRIAEPHQGSFVWVAAFDAGDDDARVYLMWDGPVYALTAPTVAHFVWDLAQVGEDWTRAIAKRRTA